MQPGETVLLTLRLLGTLSASTTRALAADLRQAQVDGLDYRRAQKSFFAKFDAALDQASAGPRYFENEQLADALAGEIRMLEELGIIIYGFAILPNHAHLLLHQPARSGLTLAKALDLLHQRTAAACRRLVRPKLPPEAQFWQPGWHEYPVADAGELARILAYVGSQPQQARLPPRYQAWPYAFSL